jgi:dTMP kinase
VNRGLLLVLEGADGVGKSTTVRGVAERLRSLAIRHSVLTFPGREAGTLGKVVYDIHHDEVRFGITAMSAAAKQALHIAAHLDVIERRIAPVLNTGEHVLLDRYWWSTWVYGLAGDVPSKLLEALIEAERIQWGPVRPALVVLLDREQPIGRDEDMNYWRYVRTQYLALALKERAYYPVEVLKNIAGVEETVDRVVELALSCGFRRGAP